MMVIEIFFSTENLMSIAGAIASACKANGNFIKIEETKIDGLFSINC